jgi:hypothetical protein
MPFCPDCRTEFRPGFTSCSDCGATLVPELGAADPHEAPELRLLLRTSDPDLLPEIAATLESAGIPFWTEHEEGSSLFPIGAPSPLGPAGIATAVRVPTDRWDEATALLEEESTVAGELPEELREEEE